MVASYWARNSQGGWGWSKRQQGELRWFRNHLRGLLHEKCKGEKAVAMAESARHDSSARYGASKSQADLRALTLAAAEVKGHITNLEWQLLKLENLHIGFLLMDDAGKNRALWDFEREALLFLFSPVAPTTHAVPDNPVGQSSSASSGGYQPIPEPPLQAPGWYGQASQERSDWRRLYADARGQEDEQVVEPLWITGLALLDLRPQDADAWMLPEVTEPAGGGSPTGPPADGVAWCQLPPVLTHVPLQPLAESSPPVLHYPPSAAFVALTNPALPEVAASAGAECSPEDSPQSPASADRSVAPSGAATDADSDYQNSCYSSSGPQPPPPTPLPAGTPPPPPPTAASSQTPSRRRTELPHAQRAATELQLPSSAQTQWQWPGADTMAATMARRAKVSATMARRARSAAPAMKQRPNPEFPMPNRVPPHVNLVFDGQHRVHRHDVDWTLHSDWGIELHRRHERNKLIKAALIEGNTIAFRSSGHSLHPRVRDNDSCSYEPVTDAADIQVHDVVFCEVQPRNLFYAHVVKHIDRFHGHPCFTIANLRGRENGWCMAEHIYGKLIHVEH